MATMYLTCGKCGSGKSYFAKTFAQYKGLRYISIDDCYGILNGDDRIRENKFDAWQLFYKLIHKSLMLGQDVIVDTNAPLVYDRIEFLNWFWEFDKHILYWIDATDETCWLNNCRRERHIPKDHFDKINSMFQPPTVDEPGCRSNWDEIRYVFSDGRNFDLSKSKMIREC